MSKKIINGLLFAAVAASGAANAAITTETIVDFNTLVLTAYYGAPNTEPSTVPGSEGACTNAECYSQNGMIVGVVLQEGVDGHLHKKGIASNRTLGYEADSTGYYMRTLDSTAFSLTSMDFNAKGSDENPNVTGTYFSTAQDDFVTGTGGPNDYWEILGFNTALNPELANGDGTNYPGTRVAYQTVPNGFNGTLSLSDLSLNSDFNNISAFWIHYNGYPKDPNGSKDFSMTLDNVKVNAVPLPAAAWMFLSGMMGLLAFGKKKTPLAG